MRMLTILDPTAAARPGVEPIPGPIDTLQGMVVAILNNRWKSMDLVAERFEAILRRDYGVAGVLQQVIPISGPASSEMLDDVAARADIAIVGLAN